MSFDGMHDDLFSEFAEQGTVTDGDGFYTDVSVIVRFGVDEIDDYNAVVGRVDTASFRVSQIQVSSGQRLEISTGEFSGKYDIGRVIENNGYVEGREIVRVAD